MLGWNLLGSVFWEGGGIKWGFPGFGWDLLDWLDKFGLLDTVYLLGFAGKGFAGSSLLGQVCWVRFAGSGVLG